MLFISVVISQKQISSDSEKQILRKTAIGSNNVINIFTAISSRRPVTKIVARATQE